MMPGRFARLASLLSLLLLAAALLAPTAAQTLSDITRDEIASLQQRLTDAKCYSESVDGQSSAGVTEALKRCPVMDPMLRIETGMHAGVIWRIGVDRSCRLLATASPDKTVRLWSLPESRLLRTLRVPIGPGNDGMVYAVAVSPDGNVVAAGGWGARWSGQQAHSVYLFDAASGTLKARVGAFGGVISHLAFSPDGHYLAATLGGEGLRVIDVNAARIVAEDKDYGGSSYGAAFASDGRLYTAAYDGFLRSYDRSFKLTNKVATRGGKRPYGLAVDPSGERVAIGFDDSKAVEVYRASDLGFLFAANTNGVGTGKFFAVAWSADGTLLAAGGTHYKDRTWLRPVVSWGDRGRGRRHEQPVARNTIMSIQPCGRGFAVGAQDPVFALLGPDGDVRLARQGVTADMRDKLGDAFRVARDGRQVRFGLGHSETDPVLFDLPRAVLALGANAGGFAAPRIGGLEVSDWRDATVPRLAGKPLGLDQDEISRSLAIGPDLKRFVLGTDWNLHAIDAEPVGGIGVQIQAEGEFIKVVAAFASGPAARAGMAANDIIASIDGQPTKGITLDEATQKLRGIPGTVLRVEVSRSGQNQLVKFEVQRAPLPPRIEWKRPAPGITWGVNITDDGRLILAAYGDGTIRWHRMSDGQELLALFVHREDKRWVAWTPSGYYMASPGAEDLIGWHVNRGWDQAADFFPASRFRARFNRPDIVQAVLDTLDENAAVKRANEAARRKDEPTGMPLRLPPVVTIISPTPGALVPGATVDVVYTLRSPSGLAVDKVDVLVEGRPVETRGLGRADIKGEERRSVTVPVPPADVEIALIARAGELASEPTRVRVSRVGATPATAAALKPKLYALVIGVGDYADANLMLGLPAKDARDFARMLESLKGGLYADVVLKVALDREVTRASVAEGLEWLEKQVTSRDVGLVFLAGHGETDERQNYWFLPADATRDTLRSRAVSQDDLRRTLQGLPGKAMLFLDTCHAGRAAASQVATRGNVDINRVVNDFSAAENGVVAFASSTGRELSQERLEWGNGAFTKAIVEGLMEGRADLLKTGTITVSQLDAYVANRVKELTGGTQHPVMTRPATVPDFPIAVVGGRQ